MASATVELIRGIYEAFDRGDLDQVFASMDEDIDWVEPRGYFVAAGGVKGLPAVQEALARYPEIWSEFSLVPETFIDAGDQVVVTGRERGVARATGREFQGRFANVWDVRDGRVVRLEAFADTGLMWKALGGHPPDPD